MAQKAARHLAEAQEARAQAVDKEDRTRPPHLNRP